MRLVPILSALIANVDQRIARKVHTTIMVQRVEDKNVAAALDHVVHNAIIPLMVKERDEVADRHILPDTLAGF